MLASDTGNAKIGRKTHSHPNTWWYEVLAAGGGGGVTAAGLRGMLPGVKGHHARQVLALGIGDRRQQRLLCRLRRKTRFDKRPT